MRVQKVELEQMDARYRCRLDTIDGHHAPFSLDGTHSPGGNLAPAAGCCTEVDNKRPRFEETVFIIDFNELERGARPQPFTLGFFDVRIAELPLEPLPGGKRSYLARLKRDNHAGPCCHAPSSRIICTSIPSRSPRSA